LGGRDARRRVSPKFGIFALPEIQGFDAAAMREFNLHAEQHYGLAVQEVI
jgi:hypothetical protein